MLSEELSQVGVWTLGNAHRRPPAKAKADPLPKATRAAAAFKRFPACFTQLRWLAVALLVQRNRDRGFVSTAKLSALRLALCILACLGCASLASAQVCSFSSLDVTNYSSFHLWDGVPPAGGGDFFTLPTGGTATLTLNFTAPNCSWEMQAIQYATPGSVAELVTLSYGTQNGPIVSGTASGTSVAVTSRWRQTTHRVQ